MNTPLNIDEFIKLARQFPIIDVRSPAEFEQGHIPHAYSIPLFDNEERAKIGTAYKQISREEAIQIGYNLANPKINFFISQVKEVAEKYSSKTVLIHCWRGGMRSSGFAELLNKYGYTTHTLVRGYKAYRNYVLKSFEQKMDLLVLGGETGSGKTEILQLIHELGEQTIDLENIAHHKGSAFGSLGEQSQPTQEQFENNLAYEFSMLSFQKPIWVEDESRAIGKMQIPNPIWATMKTSPIIRVKVPKTERIERLMNDYGKFAKEELKQCILKIEKRLGPQHAKEALLELEQGNLRKVADITLAYYDKAYNYNHELRNFKDVFLMECENADANQNAKNVLAFVHKKLRKEMCR